MIVYSADAETAVLLQILTSPQADQCIAALHEGVFSSGLLRVYRRPGSVDGSVRLVTGNH